MVADVFMASIEAITSRRHQILIPSGGGRKTTTYVWNETVANLSLMALGSSAPEIFLSVIDLFRREMHASVLGSATIVGSGAFNLLVIVAVCVVSIPGGETRSIEQYTVFVVTALFSMFAYIWVAFILILSSPDVIVIWEALVTLALLPALIYISYRADKGDFDKILGCANAAHNDGKEDTCDEKTSCHPLDCKTVETNGAGQFEEASEGSVGEEPGRGEVRVSSLNSDDCVLIEANTACEVSAAAPTSPPPPAASSGRRSLTRSMSAMSFASSGTNDSESFHGKSRRRKSIASHHNKVMQSVSAVSQLKRACSLDALSVVSSASSTSRSDDTSANCSVCLLVDRQTMSKSSDSKQIKIVRSGDCSMRLKVTYSVDLCMESPNFDFVDVGSHEVDIFFVTSPQLRLPYAQPSEGWSIADWREYCETEELVCDTAIIPALSNECVITVSRPTVNKGECGDFIVTLRDVCIADPAVAEGKLQYDASLTGISSSYVFVDSVGSKSIFTFACEAVSIAGSSCQQHVDVVVVRSGDCSEMAECKYSTVPLGAVPDMDYAHVEGILAFEPGVTEARLQLQVMGTPPTRAARTLLLVLEPTEGDEETSCFDSTTDGGCDAAILTITLQALDPTTKNMWRSLDHYINVLSYKKGFVDWKEQIMSSVLCNGSWEDQKEASAADWLWHIICLFWKVIFAAIPPTSFLRGWLCFFTSLLFIAGLTGIIAELAELFGCVLDVPDIVTAITFVALGTSMPDLFASKMAATEDPNADASIVNVTGSNSVNVFLGLGLPWSIAAIYWAVAPRTTAWAERYPLIAEAYRDSMVFVVPAGDLGFSTVVFSLVACSGLILLGLRRRYLDAELGGPVVLKWLSGICLVSYWVLYVILVSWRSIRSKQTETIPVLEQALVLGSLGVIVFVVTCCSSFLLYWYRDSALNSSDDDSSEGIVHV
eukprot:TRINITY_DN7730_c0_g1_i3.p1 TRINITY_DN7730_c0_g1~~TRINITY_DN7730_c0_g1_i3.p1  ORF type:complete len:995 (-),score=167.70 TRINITY_DN7730_c0_g1_i3:179-3001(-)